MRALLQALVLCAVLLPGIKAWATEQTLDWNNPGEVLLYRSCGCADSCWSAELYKTSQLKHQKPTGTPIASLRCDCAKLWAKTATQKTETAYEANCDRFDTAEKFTLIPHEIRQLTAPTNPKVSP